MNSLIYTTSGFLLPSNDYYTVFTGEELDDNLLGSDRKKVSSNSFFSDSELIKNSQIFQSETANNAYKRYLGERSFSNYIQLVDISISVLSQINLKEFFQVQALNKVLSPISHMFVLDVYRDAFTKTYMQYDIVPLNLRFTSKGTTTQEALDRNVRALRDTKVCIEHNWDKYLSRLADDRAAFLTFFKYIFVDSY